MSCFTGGTRHFFGSNKNTNQCQKFFEMFFLFLTRCTDWMEVARMVMRMSRERKGRTAGRSGKIRHFPHGGG
jgi:hypothetical protein